MSIIAHRGPAVILGGCGAGIAVVSAVMNYHGAHVLVPGEAAEAVAWGAVLSEFVKPFWLTGFFLLLGRWKIGEALAVLAMGVLLHTYSLVSVVGSSAEGRNTVIGEREGKQNALALAQAAASAAKADAGRVAGTRSEVEVQGDIDRLLLTPNSNDCATPKGWDAQAACKKVLTLRSEMVSARKADAARKTLKDADARVAGLIEKAPRSANPQGKVIASFFGVSEDTVEKWLPLLPSMLLEFTSVVALMLAQFFWSLGAKVPAVLPPAGILVREESESDRIPERAAWDRLSDFLLGHPDGYVSSRPKLAQLLDYPRSSFSLWVKTWEEQGLIETQSDGQKTKFLLPKPKKEAA